MLIHCATYTEARPIVEALKMEPASNHPFRLFCHDSHRLVISGIGTIATAAALSYALAQRVEPILNIGYAAGERLGTLYNIKKIIDRCTDRVYHLSPSTTLPNAVCETFAKPLDTPIDNLADMEASAVVATAKRYETSCTVFKIVSDTYKPEACQQSSQLVAHHLSTILSLL